MGESLETRQRYGHTGSVVTAELARGRPETLSPTPGMRRYLEVLVDPMVRDSTVVALAKASKVSPRALKYWRADPRFRRWVSDELNIYYQQTLSIAYKTLMEKMQDKGAPGDQASMKLFMERFDPQYMPQSKVETSPDKEPTGLLAKVLHANAELSRLCDKRGISSNYTAFRDRAKRGRGRPPGTPAQRTRREGGPMPPTLSLPGGPTPSKPTSPSPAKPPAAPQMPSAARSPSGLPSEPSSVPQAPPASNSHGGPVASSKHQQGDPLGPGAPAVPQGTVWVGVTEPPPKPPAPELPVPLCSPDRIVLKVEPAAADVGDALEDVPLVRKINDDGTPASDEDGNPLYIPKYPTHEEIGSPRQVIDEEGEE